MAKRGKQHDGRLRFLVLARTSSGPWPHPVEICLHPDGPRSRVSISLGVSFMNVGGQFALSQLLDVDLTGLDPKFDDEFDAADLHWLVPSLVQLQAGQGTADDIIEAFRERHGRVPEVMLQERFGS